MVKPDLKHNYYADLELPINASLDDVRKSYRKLALLYHPDRNAGKEEEVVPKFQAIQAANEILGDELSKQKYDDDRRRSGLSTSNTRATPRPAPGNPYAATSAYPPPPRRTQPGTWQRPPQNAGAANGADRFTNFPRPPPTARKDDAQHRTNAFRAWQNMNSPQDRQQRYTQPGPPPTPQAKAAPPPQPARSRPAPPPRKETQMPTEEQIRAGMRHKQPPGFDGESSDQRQQNWQAFQQGNGGKAGMPRSNTTRTPKKQGFNPNTPGSDERAAPNTGSRYARQPRPDEFGREGPGTGRPFPPPPPGPPPGNSPAGPPNAQQQRPHADPLRPFKHREENVPYSEGNRNRTPYSSVSGEKLDFSGDNIRRSYSTRDTTKLSPQNAANTGRARSTSPLGRQKDPSQPGSSQKPFVVYSDSDSSAGTSSPQDNARPDTAPEPSSERRKKAVPTPPSRRWNGSSNPTSPPPAQADAANPNDGFVSQQEQPGMQQKARPNMNEYTTGADPHYVKATKDERAAYQHFQTAMYNMYDHVPGALDMHGFLQLASTVRSGGASGYRDLDSLMEGVLALFPSVCPVQQHEADQKTRNDSFSFPNDPHLFDATKSRSEETININFSPGPWSGKFEGSGEYFDNPQHGNAKLSGASSRTQQRSSTFDAPTPTSATNGEVPQWRRGSEGHAGTAPQQPASFSKEQWEQTYQDGSWAFTPQPPNRSPSPVKGMTTGAGVKKQGPPRKMSRAAAKGASKAPPPPTPAPNVQNAEARRENVPDGPAMNDGDAMDIDTPPATGEAQMDGTPTPATEQEKEARLYSVAPTAWRQQQQEKMSNHRKSSSANRRAQRARTNSASVSDATKFNTNLDDLRNVEPLAQSTSAPQPNATPDSFNMGPLSTTLPFPSQSSIKSSDPYEPRKLDTPPCPTAPDPPQHLSKTSWQTYAARFAAYMQAYQNFHSTLLQHFAARDRGAHELCKVGSAGLETAGDVSGPAGGFAAYVRGVREDERIGEVWALGQERHRGAVERFLAVKNHVRGLSEGGRLAE